MTDATLSVLTTLITQATTLLTGIAWPLSVFGILYLLRKHFDTIIDIVRKRHLKIGRDGIEVGHLITEQETPPPPPPGSTSFPVLPAFGPLIAEATNGIRNEISKQKPGNVEDFLINIAADLSSSLFLERANRIILGSQIKALMYIRDTGPCKVKDLMDLYDIYLGDETKLPREAWLNYLTSWFLITITGDDVTLAPAGAAFIPYIINHGYPVDRPY